MKNLPQHVYPPQISLRGGYTGWYIHKDAWTVGAETENISTETERFFKKREGFKYKILNRGDQAFYMGAENAKIKSAEKVPKRVDTGRNQHLLGGALLLLRAV